MLPSSKPTPRATPTARSAARAQALDFWPQGAVQLVQQLLQLLFEGIQAFGPVTAAITGAVEKLLQLLPDPLRRQTGVALDQAHQLIDTPPGGLGVCSARSGQRSWIVGSRLSNRSRKWCSNLPLDCGAGEAIETVGRNL